MARERRGRDSIFRHKAGGRRLQGIITKTGARQFKVHTARLRALFQEVMGRPAGSCSQADVVEFLARGEADTRAYLEGRRAEEAQRKGPHAEATHAEAADQAAPRQDIE